MEPQIYTGGPFHRPDYIIEILLASDHLSGKRTGSSLLYLYILVGSNRNILNLCRAGIQP